MAEKSKKGTWPQAIGSFTVSILLVLTIRWLLIEAYVIPSGSMLPTLLINDHIFVNKLAYGIRWPFSSRWIVRYRPVKRGQVIVFRSIQDPEFFLVKRIVGVGGDSIRYESNGDLWINQKKVPREPVSAQDLDKMSSENGQTFLPQAVSLSQYDFFK